MADLDVLAFKLLVTPLLIGGLSLASRRYGHAAGGWLVGLPLTSGPVSVFLALERGPAFAADAATGMVLGVVAVVAFALAYTRVADRSGWALALASGFLAFGSAAAALSLLSQGLLVASGAALAAVIAGLAWLPRPRPSPAAGPPPWWDIPGRMVAATTMVVLLTAAASALGPRLTGLLSPFPVFTAVLGAFTHRHAGAAAVQGLVRGLMLGLTGFVAFFVLVGVLVPGWNLLPAYATATVVGLLVHGSAWTLFRPWTQPLPEP